MQRRTITGIAILSMAIALVGCGKKQAHVEPPMTPQEEADDKLYMVTKYVENGLFDNADQYLARLEELKPSIPAEYGPKIAAAKKMVAAEKAKKK